MLDHLALPCRDLTAAATFYDAVLPALGAGRVMEHPTSGIGYGTGGKPTLWLQPAAPGQTPTEVHVALAAPDRAAVRAFLAAALAVGAPVLHEPRVWPEYHPAYYGAFVRDSEGNNVEAVCHGPEG